MTIETWLRDAVADAERRGVPELIRLLEALAQATLALRRAGFGGNAAAVPITWDESSRDR
jgi:hypothetical protein